MSDSKCCGPKRANRQCHFDPNCILVLGEALAKGKLAIQKFGYNIAIS